MATKQKPAKPAGDKKMAERKRYGSQFIRSPFIRKVTAS